VRRLEPCTQFRKHGRRRLLLTAAAAIEQAGNAIVMHGVASVLLVIDYRVSGGGR
jgi:hypothetical protein